MTLAASPKPDRTPLTFIYKTVDSVPIALDVYPPGPECGSFSNETRTTIQDIRSAPVLVYFHAGGMTVGNRRSWFPHWLEERVTAANIVFVSADYRLIPPSTGLDVLEDIKDLFNFVRTELNKCLRLQLAAQSRSVFQIDADRVAVAGNSAGGLCAYLAAMHVVPKPKALLALYAMGGNFLIPHYLEPKEHVFFRGRELLDPATFPEYLPPRCQKLNTISDSPLAYHSADAPIPGYPANPRMLLARLYLQTGTFLDHWTGRHGLSVHLRGASPDIDSTSPAALRGDLRHVIADSASLFPQFGVDSAWPPCFLVHGAADTAVPLEESVNMAEILRRVDVPVTLQIVPDQEHSFDYSKDAGSMFKGLFDDATRFLVEHLFPSDP